MLNDDTETGQFDVTRGEDAGPGIPSTPIPGPMGIAQQNTPIVKNTTNVEQKSSGSSAAGGILGAVGGIVGKIFGGLFAEGGYVQGYAGGGPVQQPQDQASIRAANLKKMVQQYNQGGLVKNQTNNFAEGGLNSNGTYGADQTLEPPPAAPNPMNDAMAMGYLVGSYHTQMYGGSPDTLEKATTELKDLMAQKGLLPAGPGMANGGDPAAEQAIMNAVNPQQAQAPQQGMPSAPPQAPPAPQQQLEPPPQEAPPMPRRPSPQAPGKVMPAAAPTPQPTMTGFMSPMKFAEGGMGAMGGPPPLAPGQQFTGEGEVNGPGGPKDDAIPAQLSDGEFVMSAAATAFIGVDKLNKMNEQGKQGFMQAMGQVDANQQAAAGGPPPPGMPPGAPPMPPGKGMMQPPMPPPGGPGMPPMPPGKPMMANKGGPAMRPKSSGYCGM